MTNKAIIDKIAKHSLFKEEELEDGHTPEGAFIGKGIVRTFGFHGERLKSHDEEVKDLLRNLDGNFMKSNGGGWSFLNMPFDKFGNQWGEQIDAETLLAIGNALGYVDFCLPKEMWGALPGGVPYIVIDDEKL